MNAELSHLTSARIALRHIVTERNLLEHNNMTLEMENAALRRELALSTQTYQDRTKLLEQTIATLTQEAEKAKQAYEERNDLLEDEMRYSDALHDSLSEMKVTLRRVNDELQSERTSVAVIRKEYQKLQEKARAESEQLRSDLGAMYRLRDEAREERDNVIAERDQMYMEFKQEFDDHSKTIEESGNLRNAMGRTVAKYNELRYHILPYVKQCCDEDHDSVS
jgi:uncharacterized phage infection (PIP) family protein YhgE